MSRIAACLEQLRKQNRKALVPYIVCGDPTPETTVPMMHALVAAGADIIELGVPFSDPMAEGPVIQKAHERALVHHTSLRDVLAAVRTFREKDKATPVVLMGYANPLEVMGYATFAQRAAEAAVDGSGGPGKPLCGQAADREIRGPGWSEGPWIRGRLVPS